MDKGLEQELVESQSKVLLRTQFAQLSGAGTAMHSRMGKSTIPNYMVYKEGDPYSVPKKQAENKKNDVQNYKKAQLLYTLSLVENEEKAKTK